MSHPNESSDSSKPVVKDKDPHNYRKVGYSMIVISVSLVLIGLLVLSIGNNYHFSSDIMANQEVDTMTPKSGYNIVVFDYTQPVGAKLKFLDHIDTMDNAKKLQTQHAQEYVGQQGHVLIFDSSRGNNTNSISLAEVYSMTPSDGYNIVSFNTALPIGARLSSLKQDSSSINATRDAQLSQDNIKDPSVKVIVLTSSFDDNLQQILGSQYSKDFASSNPNEFKVLPKPVQEQTKALTNQVSANVTVNVTLVNQTKSNVLNASSTSVNTTSATPAIVSNQTSTQNGTSTGKLGENVTVSNSTSITLSEKIGINASGPAR